MKDHHQEKMLRKIFRKSKGRSEWALVSKKTGKSLRYFGTRKPSKERFLAAERQIQFFKHKNFGYRVRPHQHLRRLRSGKVTVVNKGVRRIGTSWPGKKFIHGPRLVDPKRCKKIRLGKKSKSGKRLVFCQLKSGKWVQQSTLKPRNFGFTANAKGKRGCKYCGKVHKHLPFTDCHNPSEPIPDSLEEGFKRTGYADDNET